jgi:hypothetical protein
MTRTGKKMGLSAAKSLWISIISAGVLILLVCSPAEGYISIDPVADHVSGEPFTITGTTNMSAGEEILVEIYSPDRMLGPKGTLYSGSVGTVKILKGNDGTNSWSYAVTPSDLKPDKYSVVVSSYGSEPGDSRLFSILEQIPHNNQSQEPLPDTDRSTRPVSQPAPVHPWIPASALLIAGIIGMFARYRD